MSHGVRPWAVMGLMPNPAPPALQGWLWGMTDPSMIGFLAFSHFSWQLPAPFQGKDDALVTSLAKQDVRRERVRLGLTLATQQWDLSGKRHWHQIAPWTEVAAAMMVAKTVRRTILVVLRVLKVED